jgi:VanZ family protein
MPTNRMIADRIIAPSNPRLAWLGVAIWLVIVGCVSLTSNPPGNDWLVALSRRFHSPKQALRLMQAVLHVALYGVGAIAVASAIATIRLFLSAIRLSLLTLAFIMVFGVAVEIAQDYVPQRRADLVDLSGDLGGAVLFLATAWATGLAPFKRRKEEVRQGHP